MKGDFSARLLSLPEAAKQDLPLAFLLFNLSKLFWARDRCSALPRDNLRQRLCADLGTAAARSEVRGVDFAQPRSRLCFERRICQRRRSWQRHGAGLMLLAEGSACSLCAAAPAAHSPPPDPHPPDHHPVAWEQMRHPHHRHPSSEERL